MAPSALRWILLGDDPAVTLRDAAISVGVLAVLVVAFVGSLSPSPDSGLLALIAVVVLAPAALAAANAFRNGGLAVSWLLTGLAGCSFGFVLLAGAHLYPPPTAGQVLRAMAWYGGWYAAVGGTTAHAAGVAAARLYGWASAD